MRKLFCLMVILLVVSSVAFSQTLNYGTFKPTKDLTITLENDRFGPSTKPPTQDVVTPVLRQKTRVTAEVYPCPTNLGTSAGAAVQAQIAGNNLPDLYTGTFRSGQPDTYQMLYENDAAWDFSDKEFLKKMFPNFTKRLDAYGSLDAWYANETTYGGKHMLITSGVPGNALSKLYPAQKGTTWASVNGGAPGFNYVTFRDDILKLIYPKARSEAQQAAWYLSTFNPAAVTGAGDPFADVPINNLNDLYNYMKKAKEIIDAKGLTDASGRDKMIAGQIQAGATDSSSTMWSTNTAMYGYQWLDPLLMVVKDRAYYNFQEPWIKDVFAWWNKCYNEGLLDPELFVKQQDQLNEEAVRGRFAVMNMNPWHGWTTNARAYAKENKLAWGYREIMAWWPRSLKATYYDSSNRWTTYSSHSGNVITKNVKEEDLAQVCNWLDYHYSEEFDILASWGPSTFYTGTGMARRYLPAYKDLENFQVYGIANPNGKDGYYYNVMRNNVAAIEEGAWTREVSVAALTNYPFAPRYVYPVKKQAGQDYDAIMGQAVGQYYFQKEINYFPQVGWSGSDLAGPEYSRVQYMWFGSHGPAMAKMIVGSKGDFEANYAAYQKVFRDNEWYKGMEEVQLAWKRVYDNYVAKYWK
jgi:hypothetical protein